jgi:polar amino acid transport system permease protein
MQETLTRGESGSFREPKPRRWPVLFDYLFYLVLILAMVGFAYYVYYFLFTPLIPASPHNIAMTLYVPFLLQHAGITVIISLVSMLLALLLGFLGALGRLARFAPFRWIATVYVEVIRGTPILVQLLFWYFGIAQVLSQVGFDPYSTLFNLMTTLQSNSLVAGIDQGTFDAIFWGIIGLSFNYGAYLTEVFRTGIESVDRGQTEAALSLGLNSRQVMRHIILPQALRITLPPFTNYFITLVQDSALLSVLGVVELEQEIGALAYPQRDPNVVLFLFIFGALFYFVICYSLALLARFLESRFAKAY